MATATVSLFSSECEVVLQNANIAQESTSSRFGFGGDGAKGSLYGLWTHAGNVIVHLAIPAKEKTPWKAFCEKQRLEIVGSWGTREPKASDRPDTLDVSLGYIYIKCSSGDAPPVFYSLPASTSGSFGYGQTSPQATTVTLLATASPYRAAEDPEGTQKLVELGRRSVVNLEQPVSLTDHWSERPEYFAFLRDLKLHFSNSDLEVKQFLQSDTLAFQIKQEKTGFSCAIAFPLDFDKKRLVQVYRRDGRAVNVTLPKTAREAFDALLQRITDSTTSGR